MRVGVDVDGVLADFNEAYIRRMIDSSGRDLFPLRPFDITTWNYPESYGYTDLEVSYAWQTIKLGGAFWYSLKPYRDTSTALGILSDLMMHGDDVYFITARPGINAKLQTENWIRERFPHLTRPTVTVLITPHKGLAARTLDLTHYIDDRWENCLDVAAAGKTKTFLMDRPWNWGNDADRRDITRVSSIREMFHGVVPQNVPSPRLNESAAT